jgi:hypothetical protein
MARLAALSMTFMPSLDATPAFLASTPDFYTKVRDIGNLKKFSHLLAHCIILSKFFAHFTETHSTVSKHEAKIFLAYAESALEWFYDLLFIGCKANLRIILIQPEAYATTEKEND